MLNKVFRKERKMKNGNHEQEREIEALKATLQANELQRRAILARLSHLRVAGNPKAGLPGPDPLLNIHADILNEPWAWQREYNGLADLYDLPAYERATAELARMADEKDARDRQARQRRMDALAGTRPGPNAIRIGLTPTTAR